MTMLLKDYVPKKKMREFLNELGELLTKHKATIDSTTKFVKYEKEMGHQVEICCGGEYLELDESELTGGTATDISNR
jgi:hypothetical protein